MKKKVVSILTAAVMMTAMITGCGSSGGATIETVEETTEAAPAETAETTDTAYVTFSKIGKRVINF